MVTNKILGGDMNLDIEKEVEKFRAELKTEKFALDNLNNYDVKYNEEKSERDLAAFDNFLQSDFFKTIDGGVV